MLENRYVRKQLCIFASLYIELYTFLHFCLILGPTAISLFDGQLGVS